MVLNLRVGSIGSVRSTMNPSGNAMQYSTPLEITTLSHMESCGVWSMPATAPCNSSVSSTHTTSINVMAAPARE